MFFDKFDFSNSNDSKIEFYYQFIIVLIQFFHSNKNQKQNFNVDKLNLIIYSSFLPIFENTGIKSLTFFDEDSKKLYVDFIIDNLSMQNVEFYEVSIMSYFKFLINCYISKIITVLIILTILTFIIFKTNNNQCTQ